MTSTNPPYSSCMPTYVDDDIMSNTKTMIDNNINNTIRMKDHNSNDDDNDSDDNDGYILVPRNIRNFEDYNNCINMNNNNNNMSETTPSNVEIIVEKAEGDVSSSSLLTPKITTIITDKQNNDANADTDNDIIYLNHAQQAILTLEVQQSGIQHIINYDNNVADINIPNNIRILFGQLIGANNNINNTIAIMPCTAFAITLAAYNIERQCLLSIQNQYNKQHQKRQEINVVDDRMCIPETITNNNSTMNSTNAPGAATSDDHDVNVIGRYSFVILQDQMESAVYPWEDICHRHPDIFHLDIIPYPTINQTWTQLLIDHINHKMMMKNQYEPTTNPIAAVCVPPLHWSDGSPIDLIQISVLCQKFNIHLIIDATQAIGVVPNINVQQLQPSILCCSIHKWLRGPSGGSLVYINPKLISLWEPLDQHGRNRLCTKQNINYMCYRNNMNIKDGYPIEYIINDACKFDSGGKPNSIILSMLQTSLQQVNTLASNDNLQVVQNYLQYITEPLKDFVNTYPNHFVSIHTTKTTCNYYYYHIIGIQPIAITTDELISICIQLKEKYHIITAVRCGVLRISSYITNTINDIQQLIHAIHELFILNNK